MKKNGTKCLEPYLEGQNFKSEKRRIEYSLGRFLILNAANEIYSIKRPEIILNNKKPELKNKEIEFSLSHCREYVFAAFDSCSCGIDAEFIRDINIEKFSERYGREFYSVRDFYKYWTEKEACIKLGTKSSHIIHKIFENNYMLCIASETESARNIVIKNFLDIS